MGYYTSYHLSTTPDSVKGGDQQLEKVFDHLEIQNLPLGQALKKYPDLVKRQEAFDDFLKKFRQHLEKNTHRDEPPLKDEEVISTLEQLRDVYNDCSEAMKWYEHDQDMRALSATLPDLVFKLEGEGEEAGDLWVKYYKAGKVQVAKAKVEYEPYDESKLEII